jgi:kynurenine formamidase
LEAALADAAVAPDLSTTWRQRIVTRRRTESATRKMAGKPALCHSFPSCKKGLERPDAVRTLATRHDDLPLEMVAAVPGIVVDDADPEIGPHVLKGLEVAQRAVLVRTGWSRHWGTDRYGEQGHPYLTAAAAEALVAGGATLVGIDSVNIDGTHTGERPVHTILLAAGIPIIEHLKGLETLPAKGFDFFAVPQRVEGMGTFPVRAFAMVP